MAPPCLQPLGRWLVCIKTGMVFPTQSYFRVFRVFRGSSIPSFRGPFVSIRVRSCPFVSFRGSSIPSFRVHSCPFVSIRGSSIPSFRGPFVVHSCPFVSIRGSSIPSFRVFRVFRGSSIPSFRVPSWSRPAGFRKKSGFWRDGTIFPEYIKSAMDPRGFSSKTATLQQG